MSYNPNDLFTEVNKKKYQEQVVEKTEPLTKREEIAARILQAMITHQGPRGLDVNVSYCFQLADEFLKNSESIPAQQ